MPVFRRLFDLRQFRIILSKRVRRHFQTNKLSMTCVMYPREAGKYIAEHSKDVSIVDEGIDSTAKKVLGLLKADPTFLSVDRWTLHALNPSTKDQAAIDWIFFSDVLNFSFWSDDESCKYMVKYGDQDWTGYWSLCAAMNRAIDEGISLTDPKYYSAVTKAQLADIMRSDSAIDMPLLDERLQILHQSGKILTEKYGGTFANVIKEADKSAQKLLGLIVENFPSFRDEADFEGKQVAMYKRAQILIGDVWGACGGAGFGEFSDIDTITMFADYRIPQALVWFGVLKYSDPLLEKLKKNMMFKTGDREEVEIRGCSVWAVELLVDAVNKLIRNDEELPKNAKLNAIILDHYLWDYRRERADETRHIPIHKIRCIYY